MEGGVTCIIAPTAKIATSTSEITLSHFNDVYHTSDPALVARFATVLSDPVHVIPKADLAPAQHHLRVFSGDAYSPSLEASVLHGDHITDLLNTLNIDVACYGNHDFDFGEARLVELSKRNNFPWTLANAIRKQATDNASKFLGLSSEYIIKTVAGYRIGFFGLAGTDWPSNCQHLPSCDILDPVVVAKRLASKLRQEHTCDLVIAITHMRLTEDISLSLNTLTGDERLDLILGGHDHHVVRRTATDCDDDPTIIEQGTPNSRAAYTQFNGNVRIIKSGTDWRGLSIARLVLSRLADGTAVITEVRLKQISNLKLMPGFDQIPPCPEALKAIAKAQAKIDKLVQQPLLYTGVALEGRSDVIRSQESNLGNMLSDAVKAFYNTDIAFVNSGGIRCDRVIESSEQVPMRVRDLVDIYPFDNPLVVKRISGRTLAIALENSVSDAHTDGRFLCLSGLSTLVHWSCPEGRRIKGIYFLPRDGLAAETLDYDRLYTVAMSSFISSGFDGYSCLVDTETLVDVEEAMTDTNLMLEIFDGSMTPRDTAAEIIADKTTAGLVRAREAIIKRWCEGDGLPIVSPVVDGRVRVINDTHL